MKMVNQDEEHLRLLSILYYVKGGLTACGACVGGAYAVIMGGVLTAVSQAPNGPPPFVGPMIFIIVGFAVMLIGTLAGLTIWTGRNLARKKNYTFCFVIAAIICLSIPLGTALGVFTMVVLLRPSVKQIFEEAASAPAS
jgi:hypothetical protein